MKTRRVHFLASCFCIALFALIATRVELAFAQASLVQSQTIQTKPSNLDFEEGTIGQVPDGWSSPTKPTYAAELTEQQPKSGNRATLLHSVDTTSAGPEFGNLMQAFDATAYRGHRVRFKAYVKSEAARAQLWLRVDRTDNKRGFFDNMMDRPITSGEWREYAIVGDVDDDATAINIGMILIGKGKAWIDAASFEDLGKLVTRAEPPRPLTARGLANLTAFTRLLGYVRHFHPSDEAATTQWDQFAIQGMLAVESAKDATELARLIESTFRPVATTVRVFPTGARAPIPAELAPPPATPSLKVVSWKHKGFGPSNGQPSIYRSERVRVEAPNGRLSPGSVDPRKPFIADLGGGVSCLVALALFADNKGTLPHAPMPTAISRELLVKYSGNDRATRLADVALAWNIFQHFYPYFDVVQTNWPKALTDALTSAATDANEHAFLITLRRMVAQLHDGHGNVIYSGEANDYSVAVLFNWVEGRLVISEIQNGAGELQPGDIVVKVDGKPSLDALTERETLISAATPQWGRYLSLQHLRTGPKDSELRLEVENQSGQMRSVVLRRAVEAQSITETRPPKVNELKPGIFYVDLGRIKDEDFQTALPQLENAKGIIFDLRGYPRVSPMVLSHLTDKPLTSARWMVPIITKPDHASVTEYDTGGRWDLQPVAPKLKGKIAFLTDGRAISYAESYMGIIEAYKLAEIIGEPTAGTNGNVNPVTLPGGYLVVFTGMKVLKHDGSQHHGVGIQPTVPVSRTIRGVREKRDEQLERAIEIVGR